MKRQRGFALIELPLVLFMLALVGLGLTFLVKTRTGTPAWGILLMMSLPLLIFISAIPIGAVADYFLRRKRERDSKP